MTEIGMQAEKHSPDSELRRNRLKLSRPAAVTAALVTLVCGVVVLSVSDRAGSASLSEAVVFHNAGALAYAALALFLGLRSNRPEAWSLGLALSCIALSNALTTLVYILDSPGKSLISAGLFALGSSAFINFTQRFPYPLTPEKCRDHLRSLWTRRLATFFLRPLRLWGSLYGLFFIAALMTGSGLSEANPPLRVLISTLVIGFGALFMTVNYRASDATGRRRLFWIAQAVALALCMTLLYASFGSLALALDINFPASLDYWWYLTRSAAILICLTIALFFAGTIDPALVIRKTAVYGLAASSVFFLFAVFENFVAGELASRLHLNDKLIASLGGAGVGLAFHPLREGINRICTRVLARLAGPVHLQKAGQEPAPVPHPGPRRDGSAAA
jgi:hypothetical protein